MKPLLSLSTLVLTALALHAGPLDRKQLSADTRWVLHLDGDALKASAAGARFLDELDRKSAQGKADLLRDLSFALDWRQIRSLTAYGASFQHGGDPNGILLVQTSMAVQAALDNATTKDLPTLRVRKVDSPAAPLYCLNDSGYASIAPSGTVILGKTLSAVEKARAVLEGKSPSLAEATLADYPAAPYEPIFLALAEGFARQAEIPPKAAVLKQADAARFTLVEDADQLRVQLTLRTASAEVAQQVQQVAQGLVALTTLSSETKPDLLALAQATTIAVEGSLVTVKTQVPVAEVLRKMAAAAPALP